MNNTDEEITAAEMEEEEWIEYMKRSSAAVIEQIKIAKITCWIETQNNEIEIGDVDSINARGKMGKESNGMETLHQHKKTEPTEP